MYNRKINRMLQLDYDTEVKQKLLNLYILHVSAWTLPYGKCSSAVLFRLEHRVTVAMIAVNTAVNTD